MNINELIEKENPTVEESIFVQNFMIDAMVKQLEHQRETIKTHEATIQSLVESNTELRAGFTEMQLAMTTFYEQMENVKSSTEALGGYSKSTGGILMQ
ncbi:hypothetical protein F485_gp143 [Aeromonas phage CC2]|uniref:Uncharacterized protein n=2 Tax=Caudoviricetes TaxID=2731619 RepID=I6X7I7_9CAUD|nr:hypothetical protein F485_gp143 [Aeromonas phage CC2]AFN39362.1 hypothetical protein CC2_156 [Aeromonas phage CC2]UKM62643.1 hypothetical protein P19_0155 [Aeromonas phage P19]